MGSSRPRCQLSPATRATWATGRGQGSWGAALPSAGARVEVLSLSHSLRPLLVVAAPGGHREAQQGTAEWPALLPLPTLPDDSVPSRRLWSLPVVPWLLVPEPGPAGLCLAWSRMWDWEAEGSWCWSGHWWFLSGLQRTTADSWTGPGCALRGAQEAWAGRSSSRAAPSVWSRPRARASSRSRALWATWHHGALLLRCLAGWPSLHTETDGSVCWTWLMGDTPRPSAWS